MGIFIASAHECPGTNLLEILWDEGLISVRDDSRWKSSAWRRTSALQGPGLPVPFEQVSRDGGALDFRQKQQGAAGGHHTKFVAAAQGPGQSNAAWRKVCDPPDRPRRISLTGWAARVTLPGDERVFCRILNRTGASMAIGTASINKKRGGRRCLYNDIIKLDVIPMG